MSTVNLTAAALVTQFLYLVILWIGIALQPRSEHRHVERHRAMWPLLVTIAILSLAPIVFSRDMTALSQSVFGNVSLGLLDSQTSMQLMFLANISGTTTLVGLTGGARQSPFASSLLMIPALAIFLHETYFRVIGYVLLTSVGVLMTVGPAERPEHPDSGKIAFLFVTLATLALGTFTSWVTRPL